MMKPITGEEAISVTSEKTISLQCYFLKQITSVFCYMVSKSKNVFTMNISGSGILKSDFLIYFLNPFSYFK